MPHRVRILSICATAQLDASSEISMTAEEYFFEGGLEANLTRSLDFSIQEKSSKLWIVCCGCSLEVAVTFVLDVLVLSFQGGKLS